VVVSSHEVNASVFLFYLPSPQLLTYSVQSALRQAILQNLSSTPGLGYNNLSSSQATDALSYSFGTFASVSAEAASIAVYAQEPAVARRRRLQQFSTVYAQEPAVARRRRLQQFSTDTSSTTSSSAYSTGSGGALSQSSTPPQSQFAVQVPVSLSGFSNSSAAAAAASAQLDVLMSSNWLYNVLSNAFAPSGVILDSIGGNTPTMSAVLQVQVVASTPEEAAFWSNKLATSTADNSLAAAVSTSIGANVTLIPRSNTISVPYTKLERFDAELKSALEGGVLAGIVVGFLILGLLLCVVLGILYVMRRRKASKVNHVTKISTPMGCEEYDQYFDGGHPRLTDEEYGEQPPAPARDAAQDRSGGGAPACLPCLTGGGERKQQQQRSDYDSQEEEEAPVQPEPEARAEPELEREVEKLIVREEAAPARAAPAPAAVKQPEPVAAPVRTRPPEAGAVPSTAIVPAQPKSAVSTPVTSPLASPEASYEHSWEPSGQHPCVWPPPSGGGPFDDLHAELGVSLHELVSDDSPSRAGVRSAEEMRIQRRQERKAEAMRRLATANPQ
jgi:hypothetical protein